MKKLFSLLLVFVLVFSFSVSAFAIGDHDTELGALNSIDYYLYWIFQDFSEDLEDLKTWNFNSMNQLLDINDFSRSIFNELSSLNDNLFGETSFITPFADSVLDEFSSLNDEFKFFSDSFFNGISWGEPFAEVVQDNLTYMNDYLSSFDIYFSDISGTLNNLNTASLTLFGLASSDWKDYSDSWYSSIYNDVHQLKEVLADDEDLAFKESQKENQQYIQDTFFKPGSDLSLNVSELTDFTSQFTDFTDSFDFIDKVGTSTSPLESISEGSDFSQWFTNETGQDMDPTFGGGSGGGGDTPDPEPDPEPDPDPDPDPPIPTITNLLPLATSTFGGSEIYNGKGWKENTRISGSGAYSDFNGYSATGYIPITPAQDNIIYLYGFTFDNSSYSRFFYYVTANGTNIQTFNPAPDENGVITIGLDIYNPDIVAVRFCAKSISSDSIVSLNQYPVQTTSTFSLRSSSVPYEPEIVTSAYSNRMNEFYKLLGGDD